MPSCAFRKCSNNSRNSNKARGVTFHVFPEQPGVKEKWIKIIQEEQRDNEWLPTKHSRICSVHFKDDMFYNTRTGLRKIKNFALPAFQISFEEPTHDFPGSPLQDVSDSESIFDTPRSIHIKRQLQKEVLKKIKYRSELQKEKKKTKRLKSINLSLRETVKKITGKRRIAKEHTEEVERLVEEAEEL